MLEGVAFGLRDSLELLRDLGVRPEVGRVSGGGARSELWLRIVASVLQLPLERMETEEGSAFGAALLAGIRSGTFADADEAVARCVRARSRVEPVWDYEEQYRRFRSPLPRAEGDFREADEVRRRTRRRLDVGPPAPRAATSERKPSPFASDSPCQASRAVLAVLLAGVTAFAAAGSSASVAGTWSGKYGGAEDGNSPRSARLIGSQLRGTISLSRPQGSYGITGKVIRGGGISSAW